MNWNAGENHPEAKLTAADVEAIRGSKEIGSVLGARYGVHQSTISRIKTGKRYAQLYIRQVNK